MATRTVHLAGAGSNRHGLRTRMAPRRQKIGKRTRARALQADVIPRIVARRTQRQRQPPREPQLRGPQLRSRFAVGWKPCVLPSRWRPPWRPRRPRRRRPRPQAQAAAVKAAAKKAAAEKAAVEKAEAEKAAAEVKAAAVKAMAAAVKAAAEKEGGGRGV